MNKHWPNLNTRVFKGLLLSFLAFVVAGIIAEVGKRAQMQLLENIGKATALIAWLVFMAFLIAFGYRILREVWKRVTKGWEL